MRVVVRFKSVFLDSASTVSLHSTPSEHSLIMRDLVHGGKIEPETLL